MLLDRHGKILDMNGRIYDWLGYSRREIIGKNLLELPFWPRETREDISRTFIQRMIGKDIAPYEIEFVAKSGKILVGRINACPILGQISSDENMDVIHAIAMISNISGIRNIYRYSRS